MRFTMIMEKELMNAGLKPPSADAPAKAIAALGSSCMVEGLGREV